MEMMPHLKALMDDLLKMAKGIVIKRTDIGDSYDTLDSIRDSDYFILASDKKDTFESYMSYPINVLQESGLSGDEIILAKKSKMNIDINKRDLVMINMRKYILHNFDETNDYYRELNGLPSIDDKSFIYVYPPKDGPPVIGIDYSMPVHEMTPDQVAIMRSVGMMDKLIADYPNKPYLKFIGDRKIDIITARLADRFDILQLGKISNVNNEKTFRDNYELARRYVCRTHYMPETFGGQQHYDAYIGMRILSQAMTYSISQNADIINTKTYGDLQTCKYILQSYGLDIFDDMPFKYQKAIADNIELLIKYKGTDAIYKLIYNLFGFTDISIAKYYLTKSVNRDADGKPIISQDKQAMYKLGMVEAPINSHTVSLDLQDVAYQLPYDNVVRSDQYWGVFQTQDEVKAQALDYGFNYIDTKYISINTIYDLTKMNFEINYLMGTLLALKKYESNFKIKVYESIEHIPIFDSFVYLFALLSKEAKYNGNIPSTMGGVASVYKFDFAANEDNLRDMYRFNFEADKAEIDNIYNQFDAVTRKYIDPDKIKIKGPVKDVIDGDELLTYYFDNVEIYNKLGEFMQNAKTKDQYQLAKMLMSYYTVSEQSTDIYKKTNGNVASTYFDYLQDSHPILALAVANTNDNDIGDKITQILDDIELVIHDERLDYMFNLPTLSGDKIKKYILKVINIFKSYTIDMHGMNTVYKVYDPIKDSFRMFDSSATEARSMHNPVYNIVSTIGIHEETGLSSEFRMRDEFETTILGKGEYKTITHIHDDMSSTFRIMDEVDIKLIKRDTSYMNKIYTLSTAFRIRDEIIIEELRGGKLI